jgi:hypothetical protein
MASLNIGNSFVGNHQLPNMPHPGNSIVRDFPTPTATRDDVKAWLSNANIAQQIGSQHPHWVIYFHYSGQDINIASFFNMVYTFDACGLDEASTHWLAEYILLARGVRISLCYPSWVTCST